MSFRPGADLTRVRLETEVVELYSRKTALYHNVIVGLFAYGWGLRVLLERGGYVRPGVRVLDAGCGTGALTRGIHEIRRRSAMQGVTIHAFDLTPAMLDRLRDWMASNNAVIDLREANVLDLGSLPPDWRGYDLVVSSAMLEYLTPAGLVVALRSLVGLLAPGGTMLVCVTRRNFLMPWLIGAWWRSRMYDRAELDAVFREAGLSPRFGWFPFPAAHLNLWGHVVEVTTPGAG